MFVRCSSSPAESPDIGPVRDDTHGQRDSAAGAARSSQNAPVRPGRSAGASRAGPVALISARAVSGKTNRLGQPEARLGRPPRSLISRGDHGFAPEHSAGLRLVLAGAPLQPILVERGDAAGTGETNRRR